MTVREPPVRSGARRGGTFGTLFESLVTLCVRVYAQNAEARTGHLRTFSGNREIDLIVEAQDKRVVAIELKLKRTIKGTDTRDLRVMSPNLESGWTTWAR